MNDKELSLVEQIYDRHNELAFSEILEFSAFSREPTFRHLQSLVKQGIVKKRQIGNLFLYSINYENPQTSSILSMIVSKRIKSMQLSNIAEGLIKKFLNLPILFALMSKPVKKGRSLSVNVLVVSSGDKSKLVSELRKIEKQIQYTTKFKISISSYDIDEFAKKLKDGDILKDMIPFFNPERLFLTIRYMY